MSEVKELEFITNVVKPKNSGPDFEAFIVLPKNISAQLPRRGRTTVTLVVENYGFQVTLEPDGNLSHWAKLNSNDLACGKIAFDGEYKFKLRPVPDEPEPTVPQDLAEAINNSNVALEVWKNTTTIARVDWVHWVESAKQAKTRAKRISDACSMLAEGKRRVCCFDNSGFYSKALKAPKV